MSRKKKPKIEPIYDPVATLPPPTRDLTDEEIETFANALREAADNSERKNVWWGIHDLFFRYMLSVPEFAIDFLKTFAPELANELDLDRLEVVPSVRIDRGFAQTISDVAYRIPFLDPSKGAKWVALILEHKAQSGGLHDKRLATQLTRYAVDESIRIADETPDQLVTPQAVVIVVYTGRDENFVPRPWSEFYETINYCKKSAIASEFPCVNVTRLWVDGKLTVGPPQVIAFARAMACAGKRKIREFRDRILESFQQLQTFDKKTWGWVKTIALYAAVAARNDDEELSDGEFRDMLNGATANKSQETRKELEMCVIDRIEARGEARGGAKAATKILRNFVSARYGQIDDSTDKMIRLIVKNDLSEKIPDLFLSADSLSEFKRGVAELLPDSE